MRRSYLKVLHNEELGSSKYALGVLGICDENGELRKSVIYYFKEDKYIFFETISAVNDYRIGETDMSRAYMSEAEYDGYCDNGVDGDFSHKLEWI